MQRRNVINNYPQPYETRPIHSRKIRYATSTGGTFAITFRSLLKLIGTVVNGQTYIVYNIQSIRVKRVIVYSAANTSAQLMDTISLIWGGAYTSGKEISATGNVFNPARISAAPPKECDAAFWISQDADIYNNPAFTVVVPQYATVDVEFDYILCDGPSNVADGTATAAVGASGTRYLALDNTTTAGAAGAQVLNPTNLTVVTTI